MASTRRIFSYVLVFVTSVVTVTFGAPITEHQQLVMQAPQSKDEAVHQGDVYLDGFWEEMSASPRKPEDDEFLYELFQDDEPEEQADDSWLLTELQDQWIEEWERYNDEDVNSALMYFSTPDDDNIVELTVMTKAKQSLVAYFEEDGDIDYASET